MELQLRKVFLKLAFVSENLSSEVLICEYLHDSIKSSKQNMTAHQVWFDILQEQIFYCSSNLLQ